MNETISVASAWSGHDSSFAILENGYPKLHVELERWIREKEVKGDSAEFLLQTSDSINHLAVVAPSILLENYRESYKKLQSNIRNFTLVGHHQAHAANAFFSSNLDKSLIITIDGGGIESDGFQTAFTVWDGCKNKIKLIDRIDINKVNIGGLWTRVTRYVFKLQSGWPKGHAAGTIMAMAAFGNGSEYVNDFLKMLTVDLIPASVKPINQPLGAVIPQNDPIHPYLNKWRILGEKNEKAPFDLAAGFQTATEIFLKDLLSKYITNETENLCVSGGVALNSVIIGKLKEWFPNLKNIYVPPTPHDGGLTLGAAQYVWHQILDNSRITWNDNFTPYLGYKRDPSYIKLSVTEEVMSRPGFKQFTNVKIDNVIDLLDKQKIIAIYQKGSESGRRALGHRSILADPRNPNMKDMINEKVKHRQWFRPFAPSILHSDVGEWFTETVDSPYMSFVLKFKEEVKEKVPAVVHADGTARLQTVTKNDDEWYFEFLTKWKAKTGVPIILNTSFNDCEPVCESVKQSLDCFQRTEIDFIYFPEIETLISK